MPRHLFIITALSFSVLFAAEARPTELLVDAQLQSTGQSNVFLDKSQVMDLSLQPRAGLALDFGDFYTTGYKGEGNLSLIYPDLNAHWHQLYVFANPSWGDGAHEALLEVSVDTLRVADTFAVLNNLHPQLLGKLSLEALPWLRTWLEMTGGYRYFYDDPVSDSTDLWLRGGLAISLPWRATLMPKLGFGLRYLPRQDLSLTQDQLDQQLEIGARLGQGLWSSAGLQLDYGYRWALGPSGLLLRKLSLEQYSYIGEEFVYSGHCAALGFKQLISDWGVVGASLLFEERLYPGWEAEDALEQGLGVDRHDWRLQPKVYFNARKIMGGEDSLAELEMRLEFGYTKQWSNSDWYDSAGLMVGLKLFASL